MTRTFYSQFTLPVTCYCTVTLSENSCFQEMTNSFRLTESFADVLLFRDECTSRFIFKINDWLGATFEVVSEPETRTFSAFIQASVAIDIRYNIFVYLKSLQVQSVM